MVIADIVAPTNQRFEEAVARGSAELCASVYTDDASILPPNSPKLSGRAAIRQFWQGAIDSGLKRATLKTVGLEVHGDTAFEVGTYQLSISPAGAQSMEDRGKFVVIWKQDADGEWRWAVDIFNSDLPAAGSA